MVLLFLAAIGGVAVVSVLLFVVFLFRADADLVLYNKQLRESYFKNRIVWVTGASSGSEFSASLSSMLNCSLVKR